LRVALKTWHRFGGSPELILSGVVHEGELDEAIERANVVAKWPGAWTNGMGAPRLSLLY